MRKLLSLGIVVFAAAGLVHAAEPGYLEEVDRFFALVEQKKYAEAVDRLYATNPWVRRQPDLLNQLRVQFEALPDTVGEYRARELLAKQDLAARLVYLNYLVAYDRQPMRFEFQFYKPGNKWMIYNFSFDADLDEDQVAQGRAEAVAKGLR